MAAMNGIEVMSLGSKTGMEITSYFTESCHMLFECGSAVTHPGAPENFFLRLERMYLRQCFVALP